jgi:hypothetical protein
MLAYDVTTDSIDEVVRITKSIMIGAFKHFVRAVVDVFGEQYLRSHTVEDTARLLEMNNNREVGHICLDALTICIGGGRIARLHVKVYTLNMWMVQL